MKIDVVQVGFLETNCYILDIDNKVLVIDPGDEGDKILDRIGSREVVGVIITHAHDDHIGALNIFDSKLVYNKDNLKEGKKKIGPFSFNVIYTPGHRVDSITIYFKEDKVMFTGDFLFKGSIGRTDLETGNLLDMMDSIDKIKKYDDDIRLYPGHGEYTTLEDEYEENPFF